MCQYEWSMDLDIVESEGCPYKNQVFKQQKSYRNYYFLFLVDKWGRFILGTKATQKIAQSEAHPSRECAFPLATDTPFGNQQFFLSENHEKSNRDYFSIILAIQDNTAKNLEILWLVV